MNKTKLLTFIDLYNLRGTVESVKLVSNGKTIRTDFMTEDKSMAGNITWACTELEECELGIFNTTRFKSLLKTLDEEISIKLNKFEDKLVGLIISDAVTEVGFMLSDMSVIPVPKKLKEIKDYDVEIPITAEFITRFTKAKSALPDADSFTLMMNKKDKMELILGYSAINSNRIKIEIAPVAGKDKLTMQLNFNANYFKEILSANSDSAGIIFRVQDVGIASLEFKNSDYTSNYFLVKREL